MLEDEAPGHASRDVDRCCRRRHCCCHQRAGGERADPIKTTRCASLPRSIACLLARLLACLSVPFNVKLFPFSPSSSFCPPRAGGGCDAPYTHPLSHKASSSSLSLSAHTHQQRFSRLLARNHELGLIKRALSAAAERGTNGHATARERGTTGRSGNCCRDEGSWSVVVLDVRVEGPRPVGRGRGGPKENFEARHPIEEEDGRSVAREDQS